MHQFVNMSATTIQNNPITAPMELQIQVPHFRQRYNWDCGLSCILMVLSKISRQHLLDNFGAICKAEGFNKSTWTIDLCYLLKQYRVSHVFYTITLGVHGGFRHQDFYEKIFTQDEERVNSRFVLAHENGVHVQKRSLDLEDILGHLVHGPAIILTNSRLLSCSKCVHRKIFKFLPQSASYQGHYILCIGYDIKKQVIFYRNPSFYDHVCSMSFASFEDSRKCFGTDQDVIYIFSKFV